MMGPLQQDTDRPEKRATSPAPGAASVGWRRRFPAVIGIGFLHVVVYYLVLRVNAGRPPDAFVDPAIAVDRWVPYIGWTWVFYYFGDVYITAWAAWVFWQIPGHRVARAVVAWGAMIVLGGLIQIAAPVVAPWPETFVGPQAWMHQTLSLEPYACLPSMHVALTVLPAAMALTVLRSPWLKGVSTLLAILITVSTVTLKEHYVLDAVTGVLLGLAAFAYWRADRIVPDRSPGGAA